MYNVLFKLDVNFDKMIRVICNYIIFIKNSVIKKIVNMSKLFFNNVFGLYFFFSLCVKIVEL